MGQLLLTAGTVAGELAYGTLVAFAVPQLAVMGLICILSIVVAMFFLDTRSVSELAEEAAVFDPESRAMCERCVDQATARFGLSVRSAPSPSCWSAATTTTPSRTELFITNNTLLHHLRNLYRKTGTHSREELVLLLRSLF